MTGEGQVVSSERTRFVRAAIGDLSASGSLKSDTIARALDEVDRMLFGGSGKEYRDLYNLEHAWPVKTTDAGLLLSSGSALRLIVEMLETLDLHRGQKVLEIGTGTGYTAALISEIVGGDGLVDSIECEPDVAARARDSLASSGYAAVNVLVGDAAQVPPGGRAERYDRMVAHVALPEVPSKWIELLSEGGLYLGVLAGGYSDYLIRARKQNRCLAVDWFRDFGSWNRFRSGGIGGGWFPSRAPRIKIMPCSALKRRALSLSGSMGSPASVDLPAREKPYPSDMGREADPLFWTCCEVCGFIADELIYAVPDTTIESHRLREVLRDTCFLLIGDGNRATIVDLLSRKCVSFGDDTFSTSFLQACSSWSFLLSRRDHAPGMFLPGVIAPSRFANEYRVTPHCRHYRGKETDLLFFPQ